jgi:FkbM family methyltransferase
MYNLVHFLFHLRRSQIELVFDVGANTGQFALALFKVGFTGRVISFEPLSWAHSTLKKAAAKNSKWEVASRCALGAKVGSAVINIAGNSYSSSLRPMLESHLEAAPESAYVGAETVPVETLAGVIARSFPGGVPRFALKIDTQGFEDEVLDGIGAYIDQCAAVLLEMPLGSLYGGAADLPTLFTRLVKSDLRCVGLSPGYKNPRTGDVIEVDGLFVRNVSDEESTLSKSIPTEVSAKALAQQWNLIADTSPAEAELADIKASISWRITAPLRYLANLFRSKRARIGRFRLRRLVNSK